jgi:hypothetical protein
MTMTMRPIFLRMTTRIMTQLESDVTKDEIVADDNRTSSDCFSNSEVYPDRASATLSMTRAQAVGSGMHPVRSVVNTGLDVGFRADLEPLDSGSPHPTDGWPHRGRILGINRPLVRMHEHLRPTPDGGVEI